MAISVDWASQIIYVPRADMTLVQLSPEIRQLDIDVFRLALRGLEDDSEGMSFVDTHRHVAPVAVGGVTLARVIEIINEYTVTFEDGQYAVNLVGANSNIGDVVNVNQVSVRSANSAGLTTIDDIKRLLKAYGMHPGGSITVPPGAGEILEDGQPIADVTGDCDTGYTVTGR